MTDALPNLIMFHPQIDSGANIDLVGRIFVYGYFVTLGILCIYGMHRFLMIFLYYWNKRRAPKPVKNFDELPQVTVQLPIYNELYVTERLIDSVCDLDYPKDKLQIQVLDDSTDESVEITAAKVAARRAEGFDIDHVRRGDRTGYKAGALDFGMKEAKGDLLAIFDADFVPNPDFLQKSVHYFTDDKVGCVQTRWGHINKSYSLLTRMQAIFLDGHFVMEHAARNWSGRFFNFSGTGGMWRRQAIDEAGGWEHDTLTEDLDLSYRSQLKNWKFVFANHIESPAELPVDMKGFKSQQDRWVKGSVQTSRKLLWRLIKAPIPFKVKMESVLHLTGNSCYILMLLIALLMFPAVFFRSRLEMQTSTILDFLVFCMATVSVCVFYVLSQREIHGFRGAIKAVLFIPMMLSLGIGMCINNARAVLSGLFGRLGGEFVRTPKYAIAGKSDSMRGKKYKAATRWMLPAAELIMGLWFLAIMAYSFQQEMYGALPFQALFTFGFLYVAFLSLFQGKLTAR